ncbi:ABC transporter ATP-binding protein [Edaphocola flava]|uniref:ABC transporter ATP-binding protein n=1 Tax=Edaphocola flava TaxID=2499629 RepID=UPI00100B9CA6|nr:ABC transporter ATP-binding protein [Edaphocola flava]
MSSNNNIALSIDNLSKQYRLGQVGTGTISHDLNRWWHKVRGKDDPYLKVGEANDRTKKGGSDYVWALKDINLDIRQGDTVGIIGRNGAGKSTLLKILSKVTKPTTGNIKLNGRIASLLEVGTGFHPEMTGRENIYLNGAILGMTKKEISRKFDEILDFSGVERYVDTPVKRYSSGMYVRLAFAVAAHLESEILIVDEVLAVGDAEFQKKCLGKMGDVARGEGRTVLFVSHNLPSIKQLCKSSVYLKNGTLQMQGDTESVLMRYKNDTRLIHSSANAPLENGYFLIRQIDITPKDDKYEIDIDDDFVISLTFDCKIANKSLALSINIFNDEDIHMFEAFVPFANESNSEVKSYTVKISIPGYMLNSGEYFGSILFGEDQTMVVMDLDRVIRFNVEENYIGTGKFLRRMPGIVRPNISYVVE